MITVRRGRSGRRRGIFGQVQVKSSNSSTKDLLADERYTEAVLGFLASTRVGEAVLSPSPRLYIFVLLFACLPSFHSLPFSLFLPRCFGVRRWGLLGGRRLGKRLFGGAVMSLRPGNSPRPQQTSHYHCGRAMAADSRRPATAPAEDVTRTHARMVQPGDDGSDDSGDNINDNNRPPPPDGAGRQQQ